MKKSQVTVFVIIGMIVVAVFGVVYYLSSLTEDIKKDIRIVDDLLATGSVQKYFNSCLNVVLTTGVNTISKQGGFIFKDQPGATIDWEIPYEVYNQTRVAYQIFLPPSQVDNVPGYPCYKQSPHICSSENYCCYDRTSRTIFGRRGDVKPDLCKNNSRGYNCVKGKNTRHSIQEQLESYISENIRACLNLTQLKERFGYDFVITNASSDVLISDNEIRAVLNMPLTVVLSDGRPVLRKTEFSQTILSKLKQLYQNAEFLMAKDMKDAGFDISNQKFTDIKVSVVRNVNKQNDSLIILSTLAGEKFQFLRKNRPPALSNIGDITVKAGDRIRIVPTAFDPDEEKINYMYESDNPRWTPSFLHSTPLYLNGDAIIDPKVGTEFVVEKTDVGEHKIKVYATAAGVSDYQTIKVHVLPS